MTPRLYLPADSVTGVNTDFDRAADFLELAAFFSEDGIATTSDLANSTDIGAPEDYTIEGYDRLPDAARWVAQYRSHGARRCGT